MNRSMLYSVNVLDYLYCVPLMYLQATVISLCSVLVLLNILHRCQKLLVKTMTSHMMCLSILNQFACFLKAESLYYRMPDLRDLMVVTAKKTVT